VSHLGEDQDFEERGVGEKDEAAAYDDQRSEEHTSELQSHLNVVCRLLLEKKKQSLEAKAARKMRESKYPSLVETHRIKHMPNIPSISTFFNTPGSAVISPLPSHVCVST